jgi:WD40 repeat protein
VQVGRKYEQSSTGVAACSIEKDRAIIVHSGPVGNTLQFWVVQLSTGRIMWTRSYPVDGESVDIRTSRDGQFIAENKSNCCPATTSTTTVYGATGAVLGHPTGWVEAFSWDGSLAVTGTFNGPVSVVRWRDGTVIWRGPSDGGYLGAMPEPGGQRIAISVSDPQHPQTGGFYPGNIYVVAPDGQAIKLLTNVVL